MTPTREAVIRPLSALLALLLSSTLALVTPTHAAPAPERQRAAYLKVTPGNGAFTAGQQITLRGNIGAPGRRRVHLETHLDRPGDQWRAVPGTEVRTNRSGDFTLRLRAHATHILYRVAAGGRRTPSWTSAAVQQEIALATDGRTAVAGEPLTLVADTTAMPLFAGRALTLQARTGAGWTTVATSTVGTDGRGSFSVVPSVEGQAVYRVRQEDWDQGIGHVGWFPSYPLYVDVARAGTRRTLLPTPAEKPVAKPVTAQVRQAPAPHQATAGVGRRWGLSRYDFDWEYGESLTDGAPLGTRRRGTWLDASSGTGRVFMRNGGLQLSSNSEGAGRAGSTGSLAATLQGNATPYGRWETRLNPLVYAGGATDYTVKVELLPESDAARGCDARAITMFEARPSTPGISIGARSGATAWQRNLPEVVSGQTFHAYAVEVTKKKITWFVDGRVVGRVTDTAAISGQPLTVRISMQASGDVPMRTTRTLADWVRAWPLGKGSPTRGGARLTPGSSTPTC
ncbi:family 16 glycosylhydrolase [Nocardioides exalbidus]|uniref:family 16 glycosylhydrolase n=1 Tax=Nocardioides exalbidus TaxID=402596 RepID=UPI000B833CBA|nr:family 16 glycosylhydrolase [Nocardioides exalbidus]